MSCGADSALVSYVRKSWSVACALQEQSGAFPEQLRLETMGRSHEVREEGRWWQEGNADWSSAQHAGSSGLGDAVFKA